MEDSISPNVGKAIREGDSQDQRNPIAMPPGQATGNRRIVLSGASQSVLSAVCAPLPSSCPRASRVRRGLRLGRSPSRRLQYERRNWKAWATRGEWGNVSSPPSDTICSQQAQRRSFPGGRKGAARVRLGVPVSARSLRRDDRLIRRSSDAIHLLRRPILWPGHPRLAWRRRDAPRSRTYDALRTRLSDP